MRFRVTLADHASDRDRETLTDIFARLGDTTLRHSRDVFTVDVGRSERRERLLYVLTSWGRQGVLAWTEENSN